MENRIEPTLDDALNTFVEENERPTAENVQELVNSYPKFREDLVEFAAVWAEQLVLPRAVQMDIEAEKLLVKRAMSHALNVAHSRNMETQEKAASDDLVDSLTEDAQRAGMKPLQLAKACGLDLGLLSKLNNRQIQPWTIPAELIRILSDNLHKTTAALKTYFAGPLLVATGKAFFSRGKPTNTGQQSFADAVRASSLSEEEKARWLNEGTVEES